MRHFNLCNTALKMRYFMASQLAEICAGTVPQINDPLMYCELIINCTFKYQSTDNKFRGNETLLFFRLSGAGDFGL
jgi:hypothetical protein